jgi:hypothetical protein
LRPLQIAAGNHTLYVLAVWLYDLERKMSEGPNFSSPEFEPPEFNPPEFNPYDAPWEGESPLLNESSVGRTVELLNETRPWVRLFGGMGIFFALLMTVGSVVGAIVLVATGRAGAEAIGIVAIYFVLGMLYLVPSRHLWRFGSRIAEFSSGPTPEKLNAALAQQKSFWKFIGVAMVIMLIIYFVVLIMAFLGAALT